MNRSGGWHEALILSAHLLLSLLLFTFVISLLVFLVRKPIRKYKPVDLAIFKKLESHTSPFRTKVMLGITFLGKHQFLIPANLLLIFYFLFINKHNWFSIRVAAIAISSLVLMLILKKLFRRKRPLDPLFKAVKGLSFPSGHAIMAVTFFGLIIYIIYHSIAHTMGMWLLIGLLFILMLLIGFSRVYLRVHYASDVLAGFIIGLVWLLISLAVIEKMEQLFDSGPGADKAIVLRNKSDETWSWIDIKHLAKKPCKPIFADPIRALIGDLIDGPFV